MTTTTHDRVDALTVRQWLERPQPPAVVDVRSPAEFETARIAGSINVPLNLVEKHAAQVAERLNREVVLVCQSGMRSAQAQQHLAGGGAGHLQVLEGGVAAYAAAGGEVVLGRGRWSLERQVRFVAGSLVFGSLLASLSAPKACSLAGGVGAGLMVSALSDACTMGRILSLLPYNQGLDDLSPEEALGQLANAQRP